MEKLIKKIEHKDRTITLTQKGKLYHIIDDNSLDNNVYYISASNALDVMDKMKGESNDT